jgi:hypothetical protein
MRIAFDLDGTLIPIGARQFNAVAMPFPLNWFFREPLRHGALALMRGLRADGHEVWVYTSSLRSRFYLWLWFLSVGVRLTGVINEDLHSVAMRSYSVKPSKFPPAFGIDLLVDDSAGVELEGKQHGFCVLRVTPEDSDWASKVREAVSCAV